jgi:hypothetical protein
MATTTHNDNVIGVLEIGLGRQGARDRMTFGKAVFQQGNRHWENSRGKQKAS